MNRFRMEYTGSFKKDLKNLKKRSPVNFEILRNFLKYLQENGAYDIDRKYKAHKLSGRYSKHWECHVLNDLLLIWLQNEEKKVITLVSTGTHSDLFK